MMTPEGPDPRTRMSANLADLLELLSMARKKVLATGQKPTEIPDEIKAVLLRLLSE